MFTLQIVSGEKSLPLIDRTYKLYYGGAQKRPDGNYCRVIKNAEGKAYALVGESNRQVTGLPFFFLSFVFSP